MTVTKIKKINQEELIERLNKNIKCKKNKENTNIECKEPVDYTSGTIFVEDNPSTSNEEHADAYTIKASDVFPKITEKAEKDKLEKVYEFVEAVGPNSSEMMNRMDNCQLDNVLKDNEACRNTVNSECSLVNNTRRLKCNDKYTEILNKSKKLKETILAIKNGQSVINDNTVNKDEDNPKIDTVEKYEMVDHPKHYNSYNVEVVDMMLRIWGPEATAQWCLMTAFKYRMRMGTKPTSPINEDIKKERWYLKKYEELKSKL